MSKSNVKEFNEHSLNLIEKRDDNFQMIKSPVAGSIQRSSVFEKVDINEVNNDEDEDEDIDIDIDILDGYLTYNMSEFHGMLGDNIDFDIEGSDSDGEDSPQKNLIQVFDHQDIKVQNHFTGQINLPPKCYNIQGTNDSTQDLLKKSGTISEQFISSSNFQNPILEGDEVESDIDIDINVISDDDAQNNDNQYSDDNADLNLFDSLDEELDENNDPYRIMIRYPNEDYKVNIFCPKMADYETDKRGNQIILRNSEMLTEHGQMDEFYLYIKQLGFQKEQNVSTLEDLIRQDQMISVAAIGRQLINMRNMQQKWLEVCPTTLFQNKLYTFSLYLNRYTELINFILEYNAGKASGRRFQHGRNQFYFTDAKKLKKQNLNEQQSKMKPSSTSLQGFMKESKDVNKVIQYLSPNEISNESTQLSVFLFKAVELHTQFTYFLHIRQGSSKYNEIMEAFKKIRSRYQMFKILKNNQTIQNKESSISVINEYQLDEKPKKVTLQEYFGVGFNNQKLYGLSKYFAKSSLLIINQNQQKTDTLLYKNKILSSKYKNSSHDYLQFKTESFNDYLFE